MQEIAAPATPQKMELRCGRCDFLFTKRPAVIANPVPKFSSSTDLPGVKQPLF
jgi:hypothetical protein